VIEYTSGIGDSYNTLPIHIQRLVDLTEEQDIIVATDGSLVFGIRYHIWVVITENKQVLLTVGGTDYGDQLFMMSYRSELGMHCKWESSYWRTRKICKDQSEISQIRLRQRSSDQSMHEKAHTKCVPQNRR
jgi:hypothetical protein